MIALYLFIAFTFGFSTAAIFSARAYDKGYNDAQKLVREGGIGDE